MVFLNAALVLGLDGRRTAFLYQLYVGGGEASRSKQVRTTCVPVVTEEGTRHKGGDGATVGHNAQFSAGLLRQSRNTRQSLELKGLKLK